MGVGTVARIVNVLVLPEISRRPIGLFFLVTLLGVTSACDMGENNVERGNREGILYLGNGSEPPSIDPHVLTDTTSSAIASALFEPLVRRNPFTLEPEPGVAMRWEFSSDQTEITFHLNPRARWSNGDPVTAQDFVWSWRRGLTPAMGMQQADISLYHVKNARALNNGLIDDPEMLGVRALDDHILHVELEHPDPYALERFGYIWAAPVHRATVEAHGEATARFSPWTRPGNFVGNGPFTLDEWKIQRHLSVKRNEYYWDKDRVALNGIVFRPIESGATEEKMFRSGQLHAALTVPKSKIADYRAQPDSPLLEGPATGSYFYLINTERPPLDDRRIRRALALSIDRQTLVSQVLNNTAIASANYVPLPVPGYDHPPGPEFDPAAARALLADAGYPGGEGFPSLTLIYNTFEAHRTIAIAIQQMWKQHLNIEVVLDNQEWRVYLDSIDEGHFDIARLGWNGDVYPSVFTDIFASDATLNYSGFANPEYDDIVKRRAAAATDKQTLLELHAQAEAILLHELPLIPIYSYKTSKLVQPSLRGMPLNVVNGVNYKYIELDPTAKAWQWQDMEP